MIYKGKRKPDYYLFVVQADSLSRVPESLLTIMGELQHIMDLQLDEQRHLAQVDTQLVMQQLRESGYYLQMPTDIESLLQQ